MENSIYGLFMEKVLQQPEATAIIENKRTLSFKELSAMVDMIADSFPDNTRAVGIVMRHRAEMIASILAVLKTGAMYIPAEPGFPTGRIHYMMEEAGVDFVLTEMQYASKLEGYEQIYSDCSICTAAPAAKTESIPRSRRIWLTSSTPPAPPADRRACPSPTGTSAIMCGRLKTNSIRSGAISCSSIRSAPLTSLSRRSLPAC